MQFKPESLTYTRKINYSIENAKDNRNILERVHFNYIGMFVLCNFTRVSKQATVL